MKREKSKGTKYVREREGEKERADRLREWVTQNSCYTDITE